jgi:hypothetical protein
MMRKQSISREKESEKADGRNEMSGVDVCGTAASLTGLTPVSEMLQNKFWSHNQFLWGAFGMALRLLFAQDLHKVIQANALHKFLHSLPEKFSIVLIPTLILAVLFAPKTQGNDLRAMILAHKPSQFLSHVFAPGRIFKMRFQKVCRRAVPLTGKGSWLI